MEKPYIEMKLPVEFSFSPESAAEALGMKDDQIIRRNIKRDPNDRYYLKSHQHTKGGKITIYAYDLEDYLKRTQLGTEYRGLKAA